MGKNRKPSGSQKPKSAFRIEQKPKTAAQNQKPDLKMGKTAIRQTITPPLSWYSSSVFITLLRITSPGRPQFQLQDNFSFKILFSSGL